MTCSTPRPWLRLPVSTAGHPELLPQENTSRGTSEGHIDIPPGRAQTIPRSSLGRLPVVPGAFQRALSRSNRARSTGGLAMSAEDEIRAEQLAKKKPKSTRKHSADLGTGAALWESTAGEWVLIKCGCGWISSRPAARRARDVRRANPPEAVRAHERLIEMCTFPRDSVRQGRRRSCATMLIEA